jgi:hypothetical protein
MMTAPRAAHAGFVGVAGGIAVGVAFMVARGMGGNAPAVALAPVVVGISALVALSPDFLSGRVPVARWGMLAFAGTVVQPMVVMGLGLFFDKTRLLTPNPYWIACLVGGLLVLITQVGAALFVLSRATARAAVSTPRSTPTPSASNASEAV